MSRGGITRPRVPKFGTQPLGTWTHQLVLKNLHMFDFNDTERITMEGVAYLWFLGPAIDYFYIHCADVIAEAFTRKVNYRLVEDASRCPVVPTCFPKDPIGGVEAFEPPLSFSQDYLRVLKYCKLREFEKLFRFLRRREVFLEAVGKYMDCKWLIKKEQHEEMIRQAATYYKTCGVIPDKRRGAMTLTYQIGAEPFVGRDVTDCTLDTPSDGGETSEGDDENLPELGDDGSLVVPLTETESDPSLDSRQSRGGNLPSLPRCSESGVEGTRSDPAANGGNSFGQSHILTQKMGQVEDLVISLGTQLERTFRNYEDELGKMTRSIGTISNDVVTLSSVINSLATDARGFNEEPVLAAIHERICDLRGLILCLDYTSPVKLTRVLERESRIEMQAYLDLDDQNFASEVTSMWNTSVLRYLNSSSLFDRELVSLPRVNSVDYVACRITNAINDNPTIVQLNRDIVELRHILTKARVSLASNVIPTTPGALGVTPREPLKKEEQLLSGHQQFIRDTESSLPRAGTSYNTPKPHSARGQGAFRSQIMGMWGQGG
uniref:Glycoprotein n=1 Tax=Guadeloupe mosquito mononega-like virus TaxID=2607732 RepID=A0A5C1K3I0_9MONO|nr:glycoprotein [Guadeloupe mosquito mononega-like virus]